LKKQASMPLSRATLSRFDDNHGRLAVQQVRHLDKSALSPAQKMLTVRSRQSRVRPDRGNITASTLSKAAKPARSNGDDDSYYFTKLRDRTPITRFDPIMQPSVEGACAKKCAGDPSRWQHPRWPAVHRHHAFGLRAFFDGLIAPSEFVTYKGFANASRSAGHIQRKCPAERASAHLSLGHYLSKTTVGGGSRRIDTTRSYLHGVPACFRTV